MTGVAILGATGSIGVSTLDVLSRHSEDYRVVALTANRDARRLFEQCLQFRPDYAVLVDQQAGKEFAGWLKDSDLPTELLMGAENLAR